MLFFRELAALIAAGTPMDEALQTVGRVVRRGALGQVVEAMRDDLRAGTPLPNAMRKHPSAFDGVEIALVEAACHSGNLAPVCEQLAARLAVHLEVRSKLVGGLAYPGLVGLSACVLLPLPLIVQASPAAFATAVATHLGVYHPGQLIQVVAQPRLQARPPRRVDDRRAHSTAAQVRP